MGVAIEESRDRRALVIDDDAANRREICEVLSRKGYEVSACESMHEAKSFFRSQPLLVAGCVGANGETESFFDHVRATSGAAQPYIIALEDALVSSGVSSAEVNDVLTSPVDSVLLESKIDAARTWLADRSGRVTGNWGDVDVDVDVEPEVADVAKPLFDPATAQLAEELMGAFDMAGEAPPADTLPEPPVGVPEAGAEAFRVRRGSGRAAGPGGGAGGVSRFHLQLMSEACPLAMAMFDGEMRYVYANAAWRRSFGLAESGLAGRGHFEIFSEVSERWQSLCERCLAEGDEQTGEELVEWADGACDWVRWLMRPWYSEDGAVSGMVVSAQSITGERRLRREQRFEADLAEAVMASPGNPLVVLDANGRIVRSNRAAKRLGRWDPVGEDEKYYWEAFLHKGARREAQERFMDFARRLLDGGEFSFPDAEIEEVVGHDGKPRRVVWTNSPRRDEDGEVNGVVRVGFDLDRHENPARDQALRDSVLHELPVPAWRCDADGEIDLVNDAWLTLRGRGLEEELGGGWTDGLDAADVDPLADLLRAAAQGRQSFSKVVRMAGADGQTHRLRFSAKPSDGEDKGCVYGIAVDVSAEHELDAARGEAARLEDAAVASENRAARFEADLAAGGVELKKLQGELADAGAERERFRSIPESAPFGIVLLGRDGGTVYCNPAHAEVAGSDIGAAGSVEDWLHAHCAEPGEAAAAGLVEDWRAKVWRRGTAGVYPLRTDDGSVRELEFRPKLMADGGLLVTMFDVTDSRRGEEALRASEAKFRALFRDSGVGMAMVDRGGSIFDSNPALESLLGYTKAEMAGRGVEEFLAGDGAAQLGELHGSLGGGGGWSGEAVVDLSAADGEEITAHAHVSQVKSPDGSVMFTTYFFHDISDQLRAERGLEDSRAENRALFGASPDMILVLDGAARVVELIPPVDFPLQVDRQASLGRELGEVLPDLGVAAEEMSGALAADGVFQHEFRVAGAGGASHFELRAARSGPSNTVVLVRDVSGFHKAQTKLKWQALTFAHIGDAIVVADMKGRIIDWNPAAEALFGYNKAEAVGLGLHKIYGAGDPEAFRSEFTAAIREHRRWEARAPFVGRDGEGGLCEAVFVPLQDEDGTPLALVGINRDVRQEEVAGAADPRQPDPPGGEGGTVEGAGRGGRAEMQGRLQTTLKTISTLLGLQARGGGGAAAAAQAGKSRVDALALLQNYALADGGFAQVDFGGYVKELVGELLESEAPEEADVTVRINAKGVTLPAGLAMPVALIANELLSNAFRHGCAGREVAEVALAVDIEDGGRGGWLVVKDDGGPLPAGFDSVEGAGLGLRIVRGLAERIGGSLAVEGGAGSEFRVGFRLPPRG